MAILYAQSDTFNNMKLKNRRTQRATGQNRKTIIGIAAVLMMSLILQSCFEIKEIIKINKDGSGTFSMVIDMSEVKAILEGFGEGDEGETDSPLGEMDEEYEVIKSKLEVIEGVSNIERLTENDGYIVTSNFDFADIEALNKGMNVIYEDKNEDSSITEYYRFKGRDFVRTTAHNLLDDMKEEMGSGDFSGENMDLGEVFSDVSYINVVTFTNSKIKKTSDKAIEVSDDGSTMTLKRFIFREDEDLSMDFSVKVK